MALCKPQIEYVTPFADSHWTSNLQSSVYPLCTFLDGLNKREVCHGSHLHNGKTSANEHDNHSKHQHQEGYDLVSGVPSPSLGQLQVAGRWNNER